MIVLLYRGVNDFRPVGALAALVTQPTGAGAKNGGRQDAVAVDAIIVGPLADAAVTGTGTAASEEVGAE